MSQGFVNNSGIALPLAIAQGGTGATTAEDALTNLGVYNTPQQNIIIGGNFDTNPWQRDTSFTNPSNGTYTADRFSIARSDDSQFNILKTADSPTIAQSDFYSVNCFHLDVTTADAAIGAAQYCAIRYNVEGYDIAFAGFGQTNAKQITLSFWHKHTVTGTYCVAFSNSAGNRSYIAQYTQDVADTWEQATITITADTSGTWLYTNGTGLSIWFTVAAGTDWQNTANQWNAALDLASASQVNGLSSNTNNFKLAQIKLEIGSVATPYPPEKEVEVLLRCQRYCYVLDSQTGNVDFGAGYWNSTTKLNCVYPHPVVLRTAPTVTIGGTIGNYTNLGAFGGAAVTSGSIAGNIYGLQTDLNNAAAGTTGQAGTHRINASTNAIIIVDAEL